MGGILADLKFALRTLRRSPLFTLIAVLSLALGIGANTAIFSLMDQLLLRLLPVKDPDSLVMLSQRGTNMGGNDGERANSYPIYQDYQQRAEVFSDVFCQKISERVALTLDGQTELVSAEMVGDLVGELQCRHAGRWDEKLGLTHGADSDVVELGAAAGAGDLDSRKPAISRNHEFDAYGAVPAGALWLALRQCLGDIECVFAHGARAGGCRRIGSCFTGGIAPRRCPAGRRGGSGLLLLLALRLPRCLQDRLGIADGLLLWFVLLLLGRYLFLLLLLGGSCGDALGSTVRALDRRRS